MITTKKDLKRIIALEHRNYLEGKGIFPYLIHSKDYQIFMFQKFLRKEEYYGNQTCGLLNKMLYAWYKRKKNVLGQKLGFDIPHNCFKEGLHIHHVGPITVNSSEKIVT